MTGGRIKRLAKILNKESFTYGDGVSNVNIKNLIKFHQKEKSRYFNSCETTCRFGGVKISGSKVKYFKENLV